MVCLAASIVTKGGKVLVSRQFVDMSRIRVEGLLAAFPKLVGSGKQHTYVETEHVRYVYQPLEGLYLLLITNKQSNILEDLETLRLLSKVVPEYVQPVDEATICSAAFELLFAFDEVISLGHKEEVTVAQVRQNTDMESNEEKLHKMIIQSKINDVNDVMKRKASEIDRTKIDKKAAGMPGWRSSAPMNAISGNGVAKPSMDDAPSFAPVPLSTGLSKPAAGARGAGKGMQLGKGKKNDILEALQKEGEAVDTSAGLSVVPAAAAPVVSATEPVNIDIEERLTVRMNKEGGLEQMEVQGTMTLLCTLESSATVQLLLTTGANEGMQFKTHPNIDKAAYAASNRIGLKDASRAFPLNTPLGVLKWRYQTAEAAAVPITVNCWPTVSGNETYINIEYESEAKFDLRNVVISIPGVYSTPKVNDCDGDWSFDSRNGRLLWKVELIDDSNRSGSLEAVVGAASAGSFFPVTVEFSAKEILCDIAVPQVVNTVSGAPVRFSFEKALRTDKFEVVH